MKVHNAETIIATKYKLIVRKYTTPPSCFLCLPAIEESETDTAVTHSLELLPFNKQNTQSKKIKIKKSRKVFNHYKLEHKIIF